MKKIQIKFEASKAFLDCVHLAKSPFQRMIGLLKHNQLRESEGMLIVPCKQIHTFFMKFPIDAIFLDSNGSIIAIEELHPWKFSKIYFKGKYVLETHKGWSSKNNLKIGDQIKGDLPC